MPEANISRSGLVNAGPEESGLGEALWRAGPRNRSCRSVSQPASSVRRLGHALWEEARPTSKCLAECYAGRVVQAQAGSMDRWTAKIFPGTATTGAKGSNCRNGSQGRVSAPGGDGRGRSHAGRIAAPPRTGRLQAHCAGRAVRLRSNQKGRQGRDHNSRRHALRAWPILQNW